ncbi:MAG TPA: hypothetical protein VHZ73_07340 [Vicinamibacterales bacterium]|jgi:hypothetical protein|nr:hypothetical protein [Vicinamibacterales bacterium]
MTARPLRHAAGLLAVVALVSTAVPARAQQVAFSRREYAATGTTYQQVWMLDVATGKIRQLTKSNRDHNLPECTADGKEVVFDAGDVLLNRHSAWSLNIGTGVEAQTTTSQKSLFHRRDAIQIGGAQCEEPVASADGKRVACVLNRDLEVLDAGTRAELQRLTFTGTDSTGAPYAVPPGGAGPGRVPATDIRWARDGRQVLVGVYGENSGSTAHASDYFIADLAAKTWRKAMSGNDAIWLPDGKSILYTTMRDLTPLPAPASAHSVWTQHLMSFDVASGKSTALTSGVTNDVSPALCQ